MSAMYWPMAGSEFWASQNMAVAVKPNSTRATPSMPIRAPVAPSSVAALASIAAFCSAASAL